MDNVGKFVDGKMATVMSGVGGQLSDVGVGDLGVAWPQRHARGRAVGAQRLARPGPGDGRAAPMLPATSVAAPSMTPACPAARSPKD